MLSFFPLSPRPWYSSNIPRYNIPTIVEPHFLRDKNLGSLPLKVTHSRKKTSQEVYSSRIIPLNSSNS